MHDSFCLSHTKSNLWQELGVDTLEMDLLFTKDKVPIIWHDVSVTSASITRAISLIVHSTTSHQKSVSENT